MSSILADFLKVTSEDELQSFLDSYDHTVYKQLVDEISDLSSDLPDVNEIPNDLSNDDKIKKLQIVITKLAETDPSIIQMTSDELQSFLDSLDQPVYKQVMDELLSSENKIKKLQSMIKNLAETNPSFIQKLLEIKTNGVRYIIHMLSPEQILYFLEKIPNHFLLLYFIKDSWGNYDFATKIISCKNHEATLSKVLEILFGDYIDRFKPDPKYPNSRWMETGPSHYWTDHLFERPPEEIAALLSPLPERIAAQILMDHNYLSFYEENGSEFHKPYQSTKVMEIYEVLKNMSLEKVKVILNCIRNPEIYVNTEKKIIKNGN